MAGIVRYRVVQVTVRLFAGLRERAGARRASSSSRTARPPADVWAALELGDEPPGLLYAVNREYAEPRPAARRRRRGGADPARLGRRVPPHRGAALARRRRRARSRRADAGAIATFAGTARRALARPRRRPTSTTRPTRAWPRQMMEQIAAGLTRAHELHEVAIHHRVGRRRDRRAERRDRRLRRRTAPPRSRPARTRSTRSRRRCRSGRRRSTRAARSGSAGAPSPGKEHASGTRRAPANGLTGAPLELLLHATLADGPGAREIPMSLGSSRCVWLVGCPLARA